MGSGVPGSVRELPPLFLPDGRMLALCEVGDPTGRPAFYYHGTGSSRLEVALYGDSAAAAGVRLVCWDRPGAGLSTPQPGRTLLDVVGDSRAVAERLGIDDVAVVGLSGGGSHVLALCGGATDLVRRGIAVNPGAPAQEPYLSELAPPFGPFMKLARDHPRLFVPVAAASQSRGGGRVGEALRRRSLHPVDLEVLERPEVRPLFEASAAEGSRQRQAWTNEALIIWGQDWGVDLAHFAVPVDVYAGTDDPFRPFSTRLEQSGARLHLFRGGHVSGFVPDVMAEVMALAAT